MHDIYYEIDSDLKLTFTDGARSFIDHKLPLDNFKKNKLVRCPCSICKCLKFLVQIKLWCICIIINLRY